MCLVVTHVPSCKREAGVVQVCKKLLPDGRTPFRAAVPDRGWLVSRGPYPKGLWGGIELGAGGIHSYLRCGIGLCHDNKGYAVGVMAYDKGDLCMTEVYSAALYMPELDHDIERRGVLVKWLKGSTKSGLDKGVPCGVPDFVMRRLSRWDEWWKQYGGKGVGPVVTLRR